MERGKANAVSHYQIILRVEGRDSLFKKSINGKVCVHKGQGTYGKPTGWINYG